MSGESKAHIPSPLHCLSLNLAAEIVYQYFSLRFTTLKRRGDVSRWLWQAASPGWVKNKYDSWSTTEPTLLQIYVLRKAKLRLCAGNWLNLIYLSTLSRLFHKQNKGMSYSASSADTFEFNALTSCEVSLTLCLHKSDQKSLNNLK